MKLYLEDLENKTYNLGMNVFFLVETCAVNESNITW